MKATRKTIPALARDLTPFVNGSGTLRGIKKPSTLSTGQLDDTERGRLRIDNETAGIQYAIVSFDTPIAWVTSTGWTYKVQQTLSQTSQQHMDLLNLMETGFHKVHVLRH